MIDIEAKQQAAQGLISGANMLGGPCREKAQTIVTNMAARHQSQLHAWQWLDQAMKMVPPSEAEEAALWDLLSRVRHERY